MNMNQKPQPKTVRIARIAISLIMMLLGFLIWQYPLQFGLSKDVSIFGLAIMIYAFIRMLLFSFFIDRRRE